MNVNKYIDTLFIYEQIMNTPQIFVLTLLLRGKNTPRQPP